MCLLLLGLAALPWAAAEDPGAGGLPRAERLLGEHNCVACHAAPAEVVERLVPKSAPTLAGVGARVTPAWLRAFLGDPHGTKAWSTMPDLLAKLDEADREAVLEPLVHFLAGLGGPIDDGPAAALPDALERGWRTYHTVGCVACHGPAQDDEDAEEADLADVYVPPGTLDPPALPLSGLLARKTTVEALARFLADPLAVRPSGHMPDLALSRAEALDVARHLLREQVAGGELAEAPGLVREAYEEDFADEEPDFDSLEPVRREVVESFHVDGRGREDGFGFRFSGFVRVPEDGEYTFSTTSDDGSQLWIDGVHVVDNGGRHAMQEAGGTIELEAGRHAIVVTMYEADGGEGLAVRWEGPGVERAEIPPAALTHAGLAFRPLDAEPFELDERRAREGRRLFTGLGCNACHHTGIEALDAAPKRGTAAARPLLELDPDAATGCLAGGRRPRVRFERTGDLGEVRALLADRAALAARPAADALRVPAALERLRCLACHRHEERGGVHPQRREFFVADEGAELGDEGRIPPDLTGVGAKLRPAALRAVLADGEGVRPYMSTRMPRFGEDNVGWLAGAFAARTPPDRVAESAALDPEEVRLGKRLAGTEGGLGCIQCHDFAGRPSLGVRAVDLVCMYERLHGGWFEKLLADPRSVNMNGRMAVLWSDGKSPVEDVYAGDPVRQIRAVWSYLSLGAAMPEPAGLRAADAAYELVPDDEPVACGVFLRGVGPRALVVGFPERTHYAFDMQGAALVELWRGRFFDARGTWEGRAGKLESPPSDDVLALPGGPAFARLADPALGWPAEPPAADWLGRRYDARRRPVFAYALGDVRIEETPYPEARFGGTWMVRELVVTAPGPVRDLWFRPFAWPRGGETWHPPAHEDGALRYCGPPTIGLRVTGAADPLAVVGRGVDLLVPVELARTADAPERWEARFRVEVTW